MKFADFFCRICILNLPERTDRLQHIRREVTSANMPFESDKVKVFPAIKPESKEPFHKLGSKGCFLSTLEILKDARDENLGNILILQDDAKFLPGFYEQEDKIVDQLQKETWDIAQFGYAVSPDKLAAQQFLGSHSSEAGRLVAYSGGVIGAHCFAVNGRSLSRFIDFLESLLSRPLGHPDGGPMPIDGAFNIFSRAPDTCRLLLVPSLVGQVSSRSDVTPSRYDQIPILRSLASVTRRLKS